MELGKDGGHIGHCGGQKGLYLCCCCERVLKLEVDDNEVGRISHDSRPSYHVYKNMHSFAPIKLPIDIYYNTPRGEC